jgi:uncharacterized protein (TIGR03083 family)
VRDDRYLDLIEQDGRRLGMVARRVDLDAPVPSCPGWTARDCVAHTAEVYQHKIACIRLQRSPGEDYEQQAPPGTELVDWFSGSLAALLAELRGRGPAAPAYTWWPDDQTVGFWYRRMAQETAVHRLDVEDALGEPTPIDPELAVDGIDEVLERFVSGEDWGNMPADEWGDVDPRAGEGTTIAVRSGDVWRSTLGPDTVAFHRGDGAADASVSGDPESVLLWLWGRRPDGAVALDGDPSALRAFRDRLRIATQ